MIEGFYIEQRKSEDFAETFSDAMYHIFLFEGKGKCIVDLSEYDFSGEHVLFTSPYQSVKIETEQHFKIDVLSFHGNFYCIEYHKNEVACNGLLFNNIYLYPHFKLKNEIYKEINEILQKIKTICTREPFADAVLKSYLQVILALCSCEKKKLLDESQLEDFSELKSFQSLVEEHFIKERSPSFYADLLHISPNTLSKKIKSEFRKTPSQIIQERVILEAKKQIHLTRKSIKEIAGELHFEDEFYFSKYFKKHTGVSPSEFRKSVGISIVAD